MDPWATALLVILLANTALRGRTFGNAINILDHVWRHVKFLPPLFVPQQPDPGPSTYVGDGILPFAVAREIVPRFVGVLA